MFEGIKLVELFNLGGLAAVAIVSIWLAQKVWALRDKDREETIDMLKAQMTATQQLISATADALRQMAVCQAQSNERLSDLDSRYGTIQAKMHEVCVKLEAIVKKIGA